MRLRPVDCVKGPDFVIAGFAKAGTTALWSALKAHPGVFLPDCKEPGYFAYAGADPQPRAGPFDAAYTAQITRDWSSYTALYDRAAGRLRGEASPVYGLIHEAPERMAAARPDMKVILCLRRPVARAFSQFAHHVRDGLEPLANFAEALDAEHARKAQGWSPFFRYAGGGFCRPVLERFERCFPASQLKCVFHDDMEAAPEESYHAVCEFLGIDPMVCGIGSQRKNTATNTARTARSALLRRSLRQPGPVLRGVSRAVPPRLRRKVKSLLETMNSGAGPCLDPELADRLSARFEDDVAWLETRFGRDLSHWLY